MHIEGVCVPGTGRERRGEVLQGKKDQYEVEMEIYNILTTQQPHKQTTALVSIWRFRRFRLSALHL
jgi:hypothetical protein